MGYWSALAAAMTAVIEAQKRSIDAQIAELRLMLNPVTAAEVAAPVSTKRKRRLSAAGRRAIAEASRKRWAAFNAAKKKSAPTPARAPRKKVSSKKAARRPATAKKPAGSAQVAAQ